jgi:pimeloyl-ACP methyl ester carboxylesterase
MGKEIAVDDFGEGAALLCVHGLGGTSNFWRPVVTAFAGGHRVIAPDLPGAGRSELDPELSIASIVRDLLALLDQLKIDKVQLVGHSMGTIICQHIAVAAPGRITGMVLLGPLSEPPEAARSAISDRAKAARTDGMLAIANAIADAALATKTKADNPNAQGFVREMLLRQPAEGYALSCIALSRAKAADLSAIQCPVLLVTGDQDAVAPEANVALLHKSLAHSEMHVLGDCGHWTMTERDTEVIQLMSAFLAE